MILLPLRNQDTDPEHSHHDAVVAKLARVRLGNLIVEMCSSCLTYACDYNEKH